MKKFKDQKLVVIGKIRDQAYAKQCETVGKDQFIFLGSLEHHSPILRSAYAACDMFALPSTLETPGLTALEAAAQGAKIMITEIGATREYFSENAYYVSNPKDPDEIAKRIHQTLELNIVEDSKSLPTIIQEKYCWEHTLQSLVKIYKWMALKKSSLKVDA